MGRRGRRPLRVSCSACVSPVPRGYALPGQGDRSPPKQVVVRSLRGIESPSAVFGYFPPVESTAPQATRKAVTASARLFGVFTALRCDGRSFNPTFLLCKRKVPLTVPKIGTAVPCVAQPSEARLLARSKPAGGMSCTHLGLRAALRRLASKRACGRSLTATL